VHKISSDQLKYLAAGQRRSFKRLRLQRLSKLAM